MEIWKDIPRFKGIYQVSNKGRLKSFKGISTGRILSTVNKKGDYLSVVLCYKDKTRSCRMHQLVAEAFIPNPDNKPEVNHKDTNKQHNYVENLEWATRKENHDHIMKNKPNMVDGMNHYNKFLKTNPIMQISLDDEFIARFRNGKEAADSTGVCQRNILQVANKEEYAPGKIRKQAGGFIWRLDNEN